MILLAHLITTQDANVHKHVEISRVSLSDETCWNLRAHSSVFKSHVISFSVPEIKSLDPHILDYVV